MLLPITDDQDVLGRGPVVELRLEFIPNRGHTINPVPLYLHDAVMLPPQILFTEMLTDRPKGLVRLDGRHMRSRFIIGIPDRITVQAKTRRWDDEHLRVPDQTMVRCKRGVQYRLRPYYG